MPPAFSIMATDVGLREGMLAAREEEHVAVVLLAVVLAVVCRAFLLPANVRVPWTLTAAAVAVAAAPFAMLDMLLGFDATNERVCVGRERTRSRVSKLMERRIAYCFFTSDFVFCDNCLIR